MIRTYQSLLEEYKEYKNPKTKIGRLVKKGDIKLIVSGIYEDDRLKDNVYYAQAICSPSYVSFQTALSMYGLIPERTYAVVSATLNKRKHKERDGTYCRYYFKDIPPNAFPYGLEILKDGNYCYTIASKEKAICDTLYQISSYKSISSIKVLIFDDLRIDETYFYELDPDKLIEYAKLYFSVTLKTFIKFIIKEKENGKFINNAF